MSQLNPTNPDSQIPRLASNPHQWSSTIIRLLFPIVAIAFFAWLIQPTPVPIPDPNLSQSYPEVAEVIRESRAVLVAHPDSAESWGDFGLVLAAHEFTNDALLCLARAEDYAPDDPRWPYFRGHILQTQQPGLAAISFTRAAERSSADRAAFAHTRAAESHLMDNNVAAAQGAIERAISQSPDYPQAAFVAARVAFARNDWHIAKDSVERANQLQPNHRDVLELYSQILRKLGDSDRANELASAANNLPARNRNWPDPWLGELQERRVDPHWRLFQAQLARENDDIERARQLLKLVVTRHPDAPQFALSLARLEYNSGQISESIAVCSDAIKRHPTSAELLAIRGSCWLLKENWANACDDLRQATHLSPQRANYWVDLAFAFRQSKRFDDAEKACLTAIRLSPDLTPAQIELIKLRLDQGQHDYAKQIYLILKTSHPNAPQLQHLEKQLNLSPEQE